MFDGFVYRVRFACVMFALILLCVILADVFAGADLIGQFFEPGGKWILWALWLALYFVVPYCRHWFRE